LLKGDAIPQKERFDLIVDSKVLVSILYIPVGGIVGSHFVERPEAEAKERIVTL
jgi:hypothetical protein